MDKNSTITRSFFNIVNNFFKKKDIDSSMENSKSKPFLLEKGHSSFIYSVTISPDGKYIVSGSDDNTIKIWDIKTAECLNTLEWHSSYLNSVTISPDRKYIRLSDSSLSQRKLTSEEIKHFLKKDNFLDIGNVWNK